MYIIHQFTRSPKYQPLSSSFSQLESASPPLANLRNEERGKQRHAALPQNPRPPKIKYASRPSSSPLLLTFLHRKPSRDERDERGLPPFLAFGERLLYATVVASLHGLNGCHVANISFVDGRTYREFGFRCWVACVVTSGAGSCVGISSLSNNAFTTDFNFRGGISELVAVGESEGRRRGSRSWP